MQKEYTDLTVEELCDMLCGKPEDNESLSGMIKQDKNNDKNIM